MRRQFQASGQPVSRTQASDAMTSRLPRYVAKCVQRRCFQCRSVLCVQTWREQNYPLPIYWHHSKGNWFRYNFAAESFYKMKLCSRLFVLYCWNCPKDDKFRYSIPIFRKLGGVEPWLMARWKARVEFLLGVIELRFCLLRLRRYYRQNVSKLTAFRRG